VTVDRNRRVLVLALLLATVSAVLAYVFIASWPDPEPTIVEVRPEVGEPVLLGARSIPKGATITVDDVEVGYVAPAAKGTRALTDSAQAIGSISLVAIPKGEQILAGSIGSLPAPPPETFAGEVPVGFRAVTIDLEETVGVGGFVQPGDRVDVIASFELLLIMPDDGGQIEVRSGSSGGLLGELFDFDNEEEEFPVAELLLQDVEVLAIGQALDATAAVDPPADADADTAAAEPGGPAPRPEAASVTLLVNPSQALRLLLAVESDAIFRLLLRAPGDTTTTELPPALITSGAIPMDPFKFMGGNLAPTDVVITDARFRQTSVPAGGILEFEATVRNVSSQLIPAGRGGAAPGHVYDAGETWQSVADEAPVGIYSVGVTSQNAEPRTYPWRWDLGEDLAPGATATITGGIQMPNTPGVQRWWFGTMLQPGTVLEDGVGSVEITIEPVSSVEVTASEIDIRESPWPNAARVLAVTNGARADVLDYQNGWFQVRFGQTDGWVPESAVTNAALVPALATPEAVRSDTEASQ
jgi:Flp pilus assembly protein CpaB